MLAFPVDDPKTTEAIKRQVKKLVLVYVECFELSVECFGKRLTIFLKVPIVCHRLARGNWTGMKNRKSNKEKTEKLQRGAWYYKRFDRG